MNLAEAERAKYTEMWQHPDYREISPGLELVKCFNAVLQPKPKQTLLDIGCGEGVAGLEFEKQGLLVSYLDITATALRREVSLSAFTQAVLWENWTSRFKYGFDYGYCCDVMEHIPPEFTMLVLDRILSVCRTAWFQIAFLPDSHGAKIGKPLHLTVHPFGWWLDRLRMMGRVDDARDICGRGVFVVRR